MNKKEVISRYKLLGLTVEEGFDSPGKIYEPHAHEKTYLWTTGGSIKIKKENHAWHTYSAGQECIIEDGEIHQAKVGLEGWSYIAGYIEEEAKKYET